MQNFLLLLTFLLSCKSCISQYAVDPACEAQLGEPGWRCASGDCVSLDWVCDGFDQCEDNSDEGKEEGQGCNLFPSSGCSSFRAQQHYKCSRSGDCFLSAAAAAECDIGIGPVNRSCRNGGEWKCRDGRCIELGKVCDGSQHCQDGSDEKDGCRLYPTEGAGCPSIKGELLLPCPMQPITCTTTLLANLSVLEQNSSICSLCDSESEWRCNDGRCIGSNLTNDGFPDCQDGSDESRVPYTWRLVLFLTCLLVSLGLLLSFACRFLEAKNCRDCFHCSFCASSHRRRERPRGAAPVDRLAAGDLTKSEVEEDADREEVDGESVCEGCGADGVSEETTIADSDIPFDLLRLLEDKELNWKRKRRDDILAKITGSRYSPICLKDECMEMVRRQYVYTHADPLQLHHLYAYLVNRSATVKELGKVTNILFSWEREIHSMNKVEVLKCWRLILGSSDITCSVINSVSDEPTLCSRLYTTFHPFRNFVRNARRRMFQAQPKRDSNIFKAVKTTYFTILPFIGGSFFYFETIKNLVYVSIVYSALYDLSDGSPTMYSFEMFLFLFMVASIVLVQVLFALYSLVNSDDIFEIAHETGCPRNYLHTKILFKLVTVVLAPLMPCFVLANQVYYTARLDIQRRHLHSFKDFQNDDDAEDKLLPETEKEAIFQEKIKIYKNIRKLEHKSLMFRKIYSYYRVTSGVIESTTFLVVLVLLMFVTGRKGRDINLIMGVEHRLRTFFSLSSYTGSFIEELNLVRDFVIGSSLLYSFLMVITALVKYWYQAKNLAVSGWGQVVLVAYLAMLTFNRLTTYIALFSTTQPLSFDNGHQEPVINLAWAVVIFGVLVLVRLGVVFAYKMYYTPNSRDGSWWDLWINVLVNSIVIVPFMVQINPLKVLKDAERRMMFSPELKSSRQASLKKRHSLLKITSIINDMRDGEPRKTIADILLPDLNQFVAPLIYDDLREEIKRMWWANPREKLEVEVVWRRLEGSSSSLRRRLLTLGPRLAKENIHITLEQLKLAGMVNVPLLNPSSTKREYFWMWILTVLENLVALSIEVINGGVWTSQGHYYSWDIRIASLFFAFMFLLMYYKKYHIFRDLTSNPVCGGWLHYLPVCLCCMGDTPLQAPADEAAMERMLYEKVECERQDAATQTNITGDILKRSSSDPCLRTGKGGPSNNKQINKKNNK